MLYNYGISDSRDRQKTEKTRSLTEKRSSEIFDVKTENLFLKTVIRKVRRRKFFRAPPKLGAKSPHVILTPIV